MAAGEIGKVDPDGLRSLEFRTQPLRLSSLFHQFFLKILVKISLASPVPRLSTVICSLMSERRPGGNLSRIDRYSRGERFLNSNAVSVTAFE